MSLYLPVCLIGLSSVSMSVFSRQVQHVYNSYSVHTKIKGISLCLSTLFVTLFYKVYPSNTNIATLPFSNNNISSSPVERPHASSTRPVFRTACWSFHHVDGPVLWDALTDGEECQCKHELLCGYVWSYILYIINLLSLYELQALYSVWLSLLSVWAWHSTASLRGKESLHAEANFSAENMWTLGFLKGGKGEKRFGNGFLKITVWWTMIYDGEHTCPMKYATISLNVLFGQCIHSHNLSTNQEIKLQCQLKYSKWHNILFIFLKSD